MDWMEYSNKLADLVGNGGYCKVKKDPTLKTERKRPQILKNHQDSSQKFTLLSLKELEDLTYEDYLNNLKKYIT